MSAQITAQSTFFMAIPTPVAYWKLDESSGNAVDSVGSNTGINTNVTYAAGKINNGAVFNGSSAYLNTGYRGNLSTFSLSFWTYTSEATSTNYDMMGRRDGGTVWFQPLRYGSGSSYNTGFYDGTKSDVWADSAITANNWCHLVFVVSGGNVRLYFNGVDKGTKTITIGFPAADFFIGKHSIAGGYWKGNHDEIGLWNLELSSTEASELYNSGAGKTYPFNTNVTVSSTVVTATFSVQSRTVTGGALVSPTTQSAVFSSPARTVTGTAVAFPSAVTAVFSLPAVNVLTPDVQVLVDAVSAVFSVKSPTVVILTPDITITPNAVTATFTVASPTIYAEKNAHACPNAVIATFTVESPTVTTERNVIVEPLVLSAVFTVLTPRKVGGLWTMTPRVEGVWTPQARVI